MSTSPDLYLVAGPNGAGRPPSTSGCWRRPVWTSSTPTASLRSVGPATRWPARYIADRRSFITESVFSHPSKVDLVTRAVEAGYRVRLRVLIVPVDLSVARVLQRVVEGGHDVPEGKIRQRHGRLWAHVRDAMDVAYETRVYDSSGQTGQDFVEVARYQ